MSKKTSLNLKHYVLFIMLLCCATFVQAQELPKNLNQDFLKRYQTYQQSLKKDREALKKATKRSSKSPVLPQKITAEIRTFIKSITNVFCATSQKKALTSHFFVFKIASI